MTLDLVQDNRMPMTIKLRQYNADRNRPLATCPEIQFAPVILFGLRSV